MSTKQLETVTGLVERINEKGTGMKVGGEWCTVSMYHVLTEMPKVGQRVNLQVERTDRGIWIQAIEVLDGGQLHQLPQPARRGGSGRSPAELRDIRKLSVLKAAAGFAASRPDLKSADVLSIAGRWLAWVEEKGGEASV